MKQKMITISLAAVMFLLALGLTLYPLISNNYNEKHQSEIHTAYQEQVAQAEAAEITEARELAIAYASIFLMIKSKLPVPSAKMRRLLCFSGIPSMVICARLTLHS